MLAALGSGFSCATEAEVHLVLSLGVPPERILFANACKRPRDVRFAADKGVRLTTFEGEFCWHLVSCQHMGTVRLRFRTAVARVGCSKALCLPF